MMPRADGRPTINELVYGTNDPDEIAAIEAAQADLTSLSGVTDRAGTLASS